HQFDRGTGEREIRLGRNGWPFRVMLSRTLVPFPVQISEQPGTSIEPVYRARARRRHLDIEDPGERRLACEKREVRAARDAEYLLIASVGRQRTRRGHDLGDHEVPAFGGRRQKAVFLVREMG